MLHFTEFRETTPLTGFDDRGVKDGVRRLPFQMVPAGGTRTVELRHAGKVTSVESTRPDLLQVTSWGAGSVRQILLSGLAVGDCRVHAKAGSEVVASLAVGVKETKTLKITCWLVEDSAGRKTKRSVGEVREMVKAANGILTPQANLEIKVRKAVPLRMTDDFGKTVRVSRISRWDEAMQMSRGYHDPEADGSVFFLPRIEANMTLGDSVEGLTYGGAVFVEDKILGDDWKTLAHELVHYIVNYVVWPVPKIRDHTKARIRNLDMLMHPSSPWGKKLSAEQINALNGKGEWVPPRG